MGREGEGHWALGVSVDGEEGLGLVGVGWEWGGS